MEKNQLTADLHLTESELIHVKDKWREDVKEKEEKLVYTVKDFESQIETIAKQHTNVEEELKEVIKEKDQQFAKIVEKT